MPDAYFSKLETLLPAEAPMGPEGVRPHPRKHFNTVSE